jgi:hypothetical protein
MSFREKSAWISFLCLLVVGGFWFADLIRVKFYGVRHGNPLVYFLGLVTALVVGEIVLHLAIAVRSPHEARTPKDERERLIDLKATRIAFYVMIAGAWLSIATIHLRFSGFNVSQCVLGSIIIAELTKFGAQIALFRRDA